MEETNPMNAAVKLRVWGRGEEEGDRQRQEERKTAREGLNSQHFWSLQNKAPESVRSHCPCGIITGAEGGAGGCEGCGPSGASHLCTGGLLDQGYLRQVHACEGVHRGRQLSQQPIHF